jgi:phospholipid/cholesterol/gamma-HCH transport system substrate-binding protein
MRSAWTEFITGTCVLVLAVVFAVVGFQRGGFGTSDESYVLNASFRSIEGVTVGTDVRLAGVNVGKVSAISLNPDSFRADMQISLDLGVELPDDTAIIIASEGLLGGNFVELQPGGSPFNYVSGDMIVDTQGSVSLLNLLMKFASGGDK